MYGTVRAVPTRRRGDVVQVDAVEGLANDAQPKRGKLLLIIQSRNVNNPRDASRADENLEIEQHGSRRASLLRREP